MIVVIIHAVGDDFPISEKDFNFYDFSIKFSFV